MELNSQGAVSGTCRAMASESGENIVMKSSGGGGSSDDAVSLDMRTERLEVVGGGRSEILTDLEFGR